jgi:hypothetical protein
MYYDYRYGNWLFIDGANAAEPLLEQSMSLRDPCAPESQGTTHDRLCCHR